MVFYLVISYFIAFTCYCTDLLDIFSLWHWIHCVLLALLPTGEKIYLRWVTILYGTSCQFLELGEGQSSICFWNSSKITFDNLNALSWPKYASYTIGSLLISFPVKNTWGLKKDDQIWSRNNEVRPLWKYTAIFASNGLAWRYPLLANNSRITDATEKLRYSRIFQ